MPLDLTSFSSGVAPGTDIRAGAAQVFNIQPYVQSLYEPRLKELDLKIEQAKKEKIDRIGAITTALDKKAEGALGRNDSVQQSLLGQLSEARALATWGNSANIDFTKTLPAQVINNPEVIKNYKRFNELMSGINKLATTEASIKKDIEEVDKLEDLGTHEANTSTRLSKAIGNPNLFAKTWIEENYLDGMEDFSRQPEEKQNEVLATIKKEYGKYAPGSDIINIGTLRKLNITDPLKEIKALAPVYKEENETTSWGYDKTISLEKNKRNQLRQIAAESAPQYLNGTTLKRDMIKSINRNNISFMNYQKETAEKLNDKVLEETGLTKELIEKDPKAAQAFFANYHIDDKGKLAKGPTINQATGEAFRLYNIGDDNDINTYFGDIAATMLEYEKKGVKYDANAFAKMSFGKNLEEQINAEKATPQRLIGGGGSIDVSSKIAALAKSFGFGGLFKDITAPVPKTYNELKAYALTGSGLNQKQITRQTLPADTYNLNTGKRIEQSEVKDGMVTRIVQLPMDDKGTLLSQEDIKNGATPSGKQNYLIYTSNKKIKVPKESVSQTESLGIETTRETTGDTYISVPITYAIPYDGGLNKKLGINIETGIQRLWK